MAKDYTVTVKCRACKRGKTRTHEGLTLDCFYCGGTGRREESRPHPTHNMTRFRTEVLAPLGTPRFYEVRECRRCGEREAKHPAGHFMGKLGQPCAGTSYSRSDGNDGD